MTIGVLGCFYDCADLLPEVLAPWKSLKQQSYPIVLGAIHTRFFEYKDLGFLDNDEATKQVLKKSGAIDILRFSGEPLFEKDARQIMLEELLRRGVDVVWLLDGDELYTEGEIRGILEYIEKTPQFDYYHVHLKNRIFDSVEWTDDFFPPRIIRTDRHGGIRVFTWDNELKYQDGSTLYAHVPGIIPKHIAHVVHHTWRRKDAEKKIAYQHAHFGYCPFELVDGELAFDERYFKRHGMVLPALSEDGSFAMANKPDVPIAYHPDEHHSPMERQHALIYLISALLVLKRENSYRISLNFCDAEPSAEERSLLELCPFETVVGDAGRSDMFHLTGEECMAGSPFIFSMIKSRLMSSPAEAHVGV